LESGSLDQESVSPPQRKPELISGRQTTKKKQNPLPTSFSKKFFCNQLLRFTPNFVKIKKVR
jgi:hypothetical protein